MFPDVEVGSGVVGIGAICSRPDVADDVIVISGYNLFGTLLRICELQAPVVYQKIVISHLCNALTTVCPFWHHFQDQEAKMSNDLQNSK